MPFPICRPVALLVGGAAGLAFASPAAGHTGPTAGGAGAPGTPIVKAMRCDDGRKGACSGGLLLTLRGEELQGVEQIVFRGARGRKDDQMTVAAAREAHALEVRVPEVARTGPIRLQSAGELTNVGPIQLDPAARARTTSDGFAFPIRGKHEIGTSYNQGFGGGRGHQGQDIFAECGKPVVAVVGGKVQRAAYEGAAGNYVVVDGLDGRSYVYMHMLETPLVSAGDRVVVGQQLGMVGETGRASGCHLHFELWTAPGWYKGGAAIDPLPELRAWDAG